jgi:hypothetical protein
MIVYKADILFIAGKVQLNMNSLNPGLYLMRVTDAHAETFTFKFVKK